MAAAGQDYFVVWLMKVLALDTSTSFGSIALLHGEALILQTQALPCKSHVEKLFPTIQQLLHEAQVELRDIGGIAVGVGPGSFTGLRVGIAAALGLSFALQIPIAGISTLRALAESARASGKTVASIIDARRREVFCATYQFGSDCQQILPEQALTPQACAQQLALLTEKPILVGDGVEVVQAELQKLGVHLPVLPMHPPAPSAHLLGKLLLSVLQKGGVKREEIAPNYIRKSDAELNYKVKG